MQTLFIIVFGVLISIPAYANFKVNGTLNDECVFLKNKIERLSFTIYGFEKDLESQLIRNDKKEINTWAIYWSQYIFLSRGLCLNPHNSLVVNTGNDEAAEHGINLEMYNSEINNCLIEVYPTKLKFKFLNKLRTIRFYYLKTKKKNRSFIAN